MLALVVACAKFVFGLCAIIAICAIPCVALAVIVDRFWF